MPVNRRWPVDTLLSACRDYFAKTGRRISFEYTMIDGVSDSPEQAQLLAKKLAGMGAHVNMIPLNNVTESGLHTFIQTGHPPLPDHSGGKRRHRDAPPDARQRYRRFLRPAAPQI